MRETFRRKIGLFLNQSHQNYALFSLSFAVCLFIPLITKSDAFDFEDILQSSPAKTRVQIVSSIGIGISFPLIVDGILDFSIKNLLRRWIYWGMVSSIILPSAIGLFASTFDNSSLYLYSAILGILLRFTFFISSVLAVQFDPIVKFFIVVMASLRIVFMFLWAVFIFRDIHNSSNAISEIVIMICDCLLILLLLQTYRTVNEIGPEKICLKVHCLILALLLAINVATFLSNPDRLLSELIQTTSGSAFINTLKSCIVAIAAVLPNRIYRASAEHINVWYLPSSVSLCLSLSVSLSLYLSLSLSLCLSVSPLTASHCSSSLETLPKEKGFCSLCLP
jgi:hypothetical protein